MDIYSQLKREILNGSIPFGSRLREEKLADRFNSSRTPIREALRKLEADGLIVLSRNKGATVRNYTVESVRNTFNLRAQIEGYACSLAAQNKTEEDLRELRKIIAQSEKAIAEYREEDAGEFVYELFAANQSFHGTIARMSGNAEIPKVLSKLSNLPIMFRGYYWFNRDGIIHATNQHKAILKAIEQGDAYTARSLMEVHIYTGRDNVLQNIHKLEMMN